MTADAGYHARRRDGIRTRQGGTGHRAHGRDAGQNVPTARGDAIADQVLALVRYLTTGASA